MGMMYHHHRSSSMGMVGLVVAMIGVVVFAALIYEIMMNRTWIAQHIPSEVKQAMPEPVSKALEGAS